jgi:hypothetical protein
MDRLDFVGWDDADRHAGFADHLAGAEEHRLASAVGAYRPGRIGAKRSRARALGRGRRKRRALVEPPDLKNTETA